MQNVSPQQWAEWKKSSITVAVMAEVANRIEEGKDLLCSASNDRDFDQFVKGMIKAFSEILDIKLDTTEEEDEDEVSARDIGPQSYS